MEGPDPYTKMHAVFHKSMILLMSSASKWRPLNTRLHGKKEAVSSSFKECYWFV